MAVAELFVAFARTTGVHLTALRTGDIRVREPDVVCQSPEGPRGVEIAGAYYNAAEAKDVWMLGRGQSEQSVRLVQEGETLEQALARVPILKNFDAALTAELQRTLDEHCRHTYSIPTYLVLDASTAALTTADEGPGIVRQLKRPAACTFLAVYLLLRRNFTGAAVFFPV
jgi:hypothetical protein